jgi:predicted amidohydrolase YtcJ
LWRSPRERIATAALTAGSSAHRSNRAEAAIQYAGRPTERGDPVAAPASLLSRPTEGSIARGKVADFAVIDGDPLADLSQLSKVTTVVRGGTVHESAELYRAVGVRP